MITCSWSGGKDSALALHELMRSKEHEVVALLTTVTEEYDRITMHGVRSELLKQQALSIGLPLEEIRISENITEEEYEKTMQDVMSRLKDAGIESVAFGDLFLEDVRRRREANLARIGMKAVFPLWGRNTRKLALEFIELGFKAITTCVDTNLLKGDFVGRDVDEDFLNDLPAQADPCGENGEFHSFVYDGPIFKWAIPFKKGDVVVKRGRFHYCDLMPQ
jgi:uncharacterized protein (TIGR00290 family)